MRLWLLPLLPLLCLADYRASNTVVTWAGNLSYNEDWGYTDVRTNAHLFWWLYAVAPANNRPLFLWLQGGPGSSGVGYGNFEEIGPKDMNGNDRASTWLQVGDLVFVDNPVGTGFSYVDTQSAYTTDIGGIGQDLLKWAIDFFAKHPEYVNRPFFIICESYGGKMSAEFAKVIYQAVQSGVLPLTAFKGVGLGDAWISAMDYVNTWGPYLYAQSYLDDQQLQTVKTQANRCQTFVDSNRWSDATDCWGDMETLIGVLTNGVSWYNVLKQDEQDDWSKSQNRVDSFWKGKRVMSKRRQRLFDRHVAPFQLDQLSDYMNTVVRRKLGIIPTNVNFGAQGGMVFNMQYADFMKPNYDTVDILLNYGLQVTVFNGQLDLICDTLGTEMWMSRLKWSNLNNFLKADKKSFKTKSFPVAGYTKSYKNLQFIYILRAGHMVAHDTEETGLYVLQQLIQQAG